MVGFIAGYKVSVSEINNFLNGSTHLEKHKNMYFSEEFNIKTHRRVIVACRDKFDRGKVK